MLFAFSDKKAVERKVVANIARWKNHSSQLVTTLRTPTFSPLRRTAPHAVSNDREAHSLPISIRNGVRALERNFLLSEGGAEDKSTRAERITPALRHDASLFETMSGE